MTDTKKSDFCQTQEALADLTAALLHLSETAELKKKEWQNRENNLKNEISSKDEAINLLTESCTDIINNIDGIISRMNKVLENDGASYSNN